MSGRLRVPRLAGSRRCGSTSPNGVLAEVHGDNLGRLRSSQVSPHLAAEWLKSTLRRDRWSVPGPTWPYMLGDGYTRSRR